MSRYYFINENLPDPMVSALSEYGCCVRLPAFPKLSEPVLRHPDMLIAEVGGGLIVHRHYIKGRKVLDALGIPYLLSEEEPELEYPRDIALNCFSAGGFFFANQNYVSRAALYAAKETGFTPVHVKQGYAKCACVIAHDAVATADSGIYAAALRVRASRLEAESRRNRGSSGTIPALSAARAASLIGTRSAFLEMMG